MFICVIIFNTRYTCALVHNKKEWWVSHAKTGTNDSDRPRDASQTKRKRGQEESSRRNRRARAGSGRPLPRRRRRARGQIPGTSRGTRTRHEETYHPLRPQRNARETGRLKRQRALANSSSQAPFHLSIPKHLVELPLLERQFSA